MTVFELLRWLDDRDIYYRLNRARDDAIEVNVTLFSHRIEVTALEDGQIESSIFSGSEDARGELKAPRCFKWVA